MAGIVIFPGITRKVSSSHFRCIYPSRLHTYQSSPTEAFKCCMMRPFWEREGFVSAHSERVTVNLSGLSLCVCVWGGGGGIPCLALSEDA